MKLNNQGLLGELNAPDELSRSKRTAHERALDTYGTIANRLIGLNDEKTVRELLQVEWHGRRRASVMKRLHSRLNSLRCHRELAAIQKRALVVPTGRRVS